MDLVRKIADAVLYEGYILWPYRRSATKNQQRWTFGGVYPQAHSEGRDDDPWLMQTQCLVEGDDASVEVSVRFLHVVERKVGRAGAEGLEFVDELAVGDARHLAWDEAAEREIVASMLPVAGMAEPRREAIDVPAGEEQEELLDPEGHRVGAIVRRWRALEGAIEIASERIAADLHRVTVRITNTSPWAGGLREDALRQTFASTHTTLRADGGEFVSLTDPPPELQAAAAECVNTGTWPVLVGEEGDRRLLLSSPIILSDYPEIAPESPGDLFDGVEIDELLTLNILSLTDEEKREMRDSDPRAREILERTESLSEEQLMNLHGAVRELQVRTGTASWRPPHWEELERPGPDSVTVGGAELRRGSRVRLWPRSKGDAFDLALQGRAGAIEGIEQDMEGGVQLAVTVEDDPGRDLGDARQTGHRFFFSPEEVEPLEDEEPVPVESARILVAGIGNVFLGDDGFGVAVADRLERGKLPPDVEVADFGIRGMDLAYALGDYEIAIFVDAAPRGEPPGTIYVIEPELDPDEVAIDTHGMDPVKVLLLARELGTLPERVLVVGCEPRTRLSGDDGEMLVELSEPVRAAVHEAVRTVESLLAELTAANSQRKDGVT